MRKLIPLFVLYLEISLAIEKVANNEKVAAWKDIIIELEVLIQHTYQGKNVNTFRGDWKRRIKSVAKSLNYKLADTNNDFFVSLDYIKSTKSGCGSTSSNYKLKSSEKNRVLQIYQDIPQDQKWVLSTGKIVNDEMKKLVEKSVYEHPVHSLIFDPDDTIWTDYFTITELDEIKSFRLKPLPTDLNEYLNIYNKTWSSAKELYMFANAQVHDPITEFDFKWIRESVIRMSELFLYDDELNLNNYSEADILHDVWPFVYRIFKEKGVKAMLGERFSVAVALARNANRSLEAMERRPRKIPGSRVDVLFKIVNDELGTCEVGKDKVIAVDDKYLDDGLVKLPKTLRDMLSVLVQKNPAQANNISSVGFLMMGK